MLGLDMPGADLGKERLEPGDTIVLYTDGITEARDSENHFFGLDRLIDTIERAAADRKLLPEMVQNLFRSILRHQGGVLQDDATLLLIQWTTQAQATLDPTPQ